MSLDTVMQHLERFGWAVFSSRDLEPGKLMENLGLVIMENDVSIVQTKPFLRTQTIIS
jgi:hypothetical protein